MCIMLYKNFQAEEFEAYLYWMPDDTQVVKQLFDTPNGKAGPVKGTVIKDLFYEPGKQDPEPMKAKT